MSLISGLAGLARKLRALLRSPCASSSPASDRESEGEPQPNAAGEAARSEGAEEAESGPGEQPPLGTTRRRFLAGLAVAAGGGIGALVSVPPLAFLFWPLFREEPPAWREVGSVDDFAVDEMIPVSFAEPSPIPWAGVTAESAAYVRRLDDEQFVAFSIYCTHQGCQVRWLREGQIFMCPCHAGVFHRDGSVAAGPPPRPLVRHAIRVRDGIVEIQTRPLPVGEGVLIEEDGNDIEEQPR